MPNPLTRYLLFLYLSHFSSSLIPCYYRSVWPSEVPLQELLQHKSVIKIDVWMFAMTQKSMIVAQRCNSLFLLSCLRAFCHICSHPATDFRCNFIAWQINRVCCECSIRHAKSRRKPSGGYLSKSLPGGQPHCGSGKWQSCKAFAWKCALMDNQVVQSVLLLLFFLTSRRDLAISPSPVA